MKTINKVIIALAIGGLICAIVGFGLGGNKQIQTLYENDDLNIGWHPKYHTINEEYADINRLDINVDAMNVVVKEYDGETIKVEGEIRTSVDIEKRGNTLVMEENGWSISVGLTWENRELVMYVPEGTVFESADFDLDAGSIDIEGTLRADYSEIDVDAGSFYANSIIVEELMVDIDAGSAEVALLDSKKSEIDVDAGKFVAEMTGTDDDYSYIADVDAGSITIGDYDSSGISDEDTGGHGDRKIDATCDAGSIKIRMRGD